MIFRLMRRPLMGMVPLYKGAIFRSLLIRLLAYSQMLRLRPNPFTFMNFYCAYCL
jgi:hypothetical protein